MSKLLLKVMWIGLLTALIGIPLWCYLTYDPHAPVAPPVATLVIEDELSSDAFDHFLEGGELIPIPAPQENETAVAPVAESPVTESPMTESPVTELVP